MADPRRVVVDIANCNVCHDQLAFHGGQRLNTQECVLCHNPNFTADEDPQEGLDFKRLIHRIHRGEDLTQPYLDFNHVRFPGDLRDCATCHVDATGRCPRPGQPGRLATQTPPDWYTPQQPTAAACLGCHDSQSAAAHAFVNTAPFPARPARPATEPTRSSPSTRCTRNSAVVEDRVESGGVRV